MVIIQVAVGCLVVCVLAGSAFAQPAPAGPSKVKSVWAPAKHDDKGNLLPLQSYGETLDRAMKFILEDQATWAKGNKITDEQGNTRPPYFFYCIAVDGQLDGVGEPWNRNQSYPAGHHACYISAFLDYYEYSGRKETIKLAEDLADWNLAHSTPPDWPYGGLPYSTAVNGRTGASTDSKDGDAIITIGTAGMAGNYLRLYRVTKKPQYLKGARQIADTLAKTQLPEGNWAFRVNPRTGEVKEKYTSAVISVIELFETLDAFSKDTRYQKAREKAFAWLLKGPCVDMHWGGLFEDVGDAPENRTNGDCIDTARYLIRHRSENKDYLPLAMKLHDWVKATFVDETGHLYAPAPATREQLVCNFRMSGHTGHWGQLQGDLYVVTGDEKYRAGMANAASYMTYHLQPDNRICVGPEWDERANGFWYSSQFSAVILLKSLLGFMPEAAPDGENHLIRASGVVTKISYAPARVVYTTDAASSDALKLAFAPSRITVNGKGLPEGTGVERSWKFDAKTKVLRLAHDAGEVAVSGK